MLGRIASPSARMKMSLMPPALLDVSTWVGAARPLIGAGQRTRKQSDQHGEKAKQSHGHSP